PAFRTCRRIVVGGKELVLKVLRPRLIVRMLVFGGGGKESLVRLPRLARKASQPMADGRIVEAGRERAAGDAQQRSGRIVVGVRRGAECRQGGLVPPVVTVLAVAHALELAFDASPQGRLVTAR